MQSHQAGLLREPALGGINIAHMQLVPQNHGLLDEHLAALLMSIYPQVSFRLHANVRVLTAHRIADIAGLETHADWFAQAAKISKLIKAPAYTAHSGYRAVATMAQMLDNTRRLGDLFGCPVGVEGQYPTMGNELLVSTWDEYEQVFMSGVPYALDLSHLNILAHKTCTREDALVKEMLSCERCIEVHLSDNDGNGDFHQVCDTQPWWFELLEYVNDNAVVFTEGNHLRKRKTS